MHACSINGRLCGTEDAMLPVMDHGLLYGDGVFEGLRFYAGRVFRLGQHLKRLDESARAIGLSIPMSHEDLRHSIYELINDSGLSDGYIRLIITRGEGSLGLDPDRCGIPNTIMIADELLMVEENDRLQGIKTIIASTRKLASDQIDPRIKSLNYLNQILAKQEATSAGAHEAIILNMAGHVAEGTADNIFVVKDGVLITPPVSEGALDGITRGAIIELARDLGIHCKEEVLAPFDLFTSDECFLTGTGAELIPIASIGGRTLPVSRAQFSRLEIAFKELVYELEPDSIPASAVV